MANETPNEDSLLEETIQTQPASLSKVKEALRISDAIALTSSNEVATTKNSSSTAEIPVTSKADKSQSITENNVAKLELTTSPPATGKTAKNLKIVEIKSASVEIKSNDPGKVCSKTANNATLKHPTPKVTESSIKASQKLTSSTKEDVTRISLHQTSSKTPTSSTAKTSTTKISQTSVKTAQKTPTAIAKTERVVPKTKVNISSTAAQKPGETSLTTSQKSTTSFPKKVAPTNTKETLPAKQQKIALSHHTKAASTNQPPTVKNVCAKKIPTTPTSVVPQSSKSQAPPKPSATKLSADIKKPEGSAKPVATETKPVLNQKKINITQSHSSKTIEASSEKKSTSETNMPSLKVPRVRLVKIDSVTHSSKDKTNEAPTIRDATPDKPASRPASDKSSSLPSQIKPSLKSSIPSKSTSLTVTNKNTAQSPKKPSLNKTSVKMPQPTTTNYSKSPPSVQQKDDKVNIINYGALKSQSDTSKSLTEKNDEKKTDIHTLVDYKIPRKQSDAPKNPVTSAKTNSSTTVITTVGKSQNEIKKPVQNTTALKESIEPTENVQNYSSKIIDFHLHQKISQETVIAESITSCDSMDKKMSDSEGKDDADVCLKDLEKVPWEQLLDDSPDEDNPKKKEVQSISLLNCTSEVKSEVSNANICENTNVSKNQSSATAEVPNKKIKDEQIPELEEKTKQEISVNNKKDNSVRKNITLNLKKDLGNKKESGDIIVIDEVQETVHKKNKPDKRESYGNRKDKSERRTLSKPKETVTENKPTNQQSKALEPKEKSIPPTSTNCEKSAYTARPKVEKSGDRRWFNNATRSKERTRSPSPARGSYPSQSRHLSRNSYTFRSRSRSRSRLRRDRSASRDRRWKRRISDEERKSPKRPRTQSSTSSNLPLAGQEVFEWQREQPRNPTICDPVINQCQGQPFVNCPQPGMNQFLNQPYQPYVASMMVNTMVSPNAPYHPLPPLSGAHAVSNTFPIMRQYSTLAVSTVAPTNIPQSQFPNVKPTRFEKFAPDAPFLGTQNTQSQETLKIGISSGTHRIVVQTEEPKHTDPQVTNQVVNKINEIYEKTIPSWQKTKHSVSSNISETSKIAAVEKTTIAPDPVENSLKREREIMDKSESKCVYKSVTNALTESFSSLIWTSRKDDDDRRIFTAVDVPWESDNAHEGRFSQWNSRISALPESRQNVISNALRDRDEELVVVLMQAHYEIPPMKFTFDMVRECWKFAVEMKTIQPIDVWKEFDKYTNRLSVGRRKIAELLLKSGDAYGLRAFLWFYNERSNFIPLDNASERCAVDRLLHTIKTLGLNLNTPKREISSFRNSLQNIAYELNISENTLRIPIIHGDFSVARRRLESTRYVVPAHSRRPRKLCVLPQQPIVQMPDSEKNNIFVTLKPNSREVHVNSIRSTIKQHLTENSKSMEVISSIIQKDSRDLILIVCHADYPTKMLGRDEGFQMILKVQDLARVKFPSQCVVQRMKILQGMMLIKCGEQLFLPWLLNAIPSNFPHLRVELLVDVVELRKVVDKSETFQPAKVQSSQNNSTKPYDPPTKPSQTSSDKPICQNEVVSPVRLMAKTLRIANNPEKQNLNEYEEYLFDKTTSSDEEIVDNSQNCSNKVIRLDEDMDLSDLSDDNSKTNQTKGKIKINIKGALPTTSEKKTEEETIVRPERKKIHQPQTEPVPGPSTLSEDPPKRLSIVNKLKNLMKMICEEDNIAEDELLAGLQSTGSSNVNRIEPEIVPPPPPSVDINEWDGFGHGNDADEPAPKRSKKKTQSLIDLLIATSKEAKKDATVIMDVTFPGSPPEEWNPKSTLKLLESHNPGLCIDSWSIEAMRLEKTWQSMKLKVDEKSASYIRRRDYQLLYKKFLVDFRILE